MNITLSDDGHVEINGLHYTGHNISINGARVVIDGVTQDAILTRVVNVNVVGNCESIESASGQVMVQGTVGRILTGSGDVTCGDVSGSVQTGSGDVTCDAVAGSVRTGSGDIRHG